MNNKGFFLVFLITLCGCTTTANYSTIKDQNTGKVSVFYLTDDVESAPLSANHANQIATRYCKQLGYSYTELNVAIAQQCNSIGSDGSCSHWMVEKAYQCAGNAISEPQNQPIATISQTSNSSRP